MNGSGGIIADLDIRKARKLDAVRNLIQEIDAEEDRKKVVAEAANDRLKVLRTSLKELLDQSDDQYEFDFVPRPVHG